MSGWGIRARAADGITVTFDSTKEMTLFPIDDRVINGSDVGSGISFQYPNYAGKKINAFLSSPYSVGEEDHWAIQSCRVSYPGGIPTVTVFFDNPVSGSPKCDGHLYVMYTGAPQ